MEIKFKDEHTCYHCNTNYEVLVTAKKSATYKEGIESLELVTVQDLKTGRELNLSRLDFITKYLWRKKAFELYQKELQNVGDEV